MQFVGSFLALQDGEHTERGREIVAQGPTVYEQQERQMGKLRTKTVKNRSLEKKTKKEENTNASA